jgi:simple sugar transport system ATP-binding protein
VPQSAAETATAVSSPEPVLEVRGLTKRFDGVVALDGVDFALRSGEVHALMGENGAGKSTLIKCLTGVHSPTAGEILLAGRAIALSSPREAEAMGIAAVFQEVGLIPHMSIAENVCLGREPLRAGWPRRIDWKAVRARAAASLGRLGLGGLDVNRELSTCSVAVQQLVAIARALDMRPRVLILDEPTSSLDRDEAAQLLDVIRTLRSDGLGVVFISHVLDQVDGVADRITVLRDGKLVGVRDAKGLSRATLVSMMVGREFDSLPAPSSKTDAAERSEGSLLSARGIGRAGMLEHADVSVERGECVGLAGLLGSGRTETARLLFGAERIDRGTLAFRGSATRFDTPREAIAAGLAFTPENRKADGVIPDLSVRENIVLALQAKRGVLHRLSAAAQHALADKYIALLGIKTRDAESPISALSGGNQQKALLARWLATDPALLILDEPTRGIDIAAKAEILKAIHDLRSRGMAVLFISSELEEVVRTCSRVVVMRDRRSVAELSGTQVSEPSILNAIAQRHA